MRFLFWAALCLLSQSGLVLAQNPFSDWQGAARLEVGIPPEQLELDKPVVAMVSKNEDYWIDSAAIVSADADRIFEVSRDYDHYADIAPFVLDSRIMPSEKGTTDLFVWSKMRYEVQFVIKTHLIPMYYLRVQPLAGVLQPNDFGLRWRLETPHEGWKFPTETYFSILDGSWYILPLGQGRTYVRYYLRIRTNTWVPNSVVRSMLRDSLEPGIKRLILSIAKRASRL
jgi:hypothetical protein